jgi:hypothetical protein
MPRGEERRNSIIGGLAVLLIRGVLLWVVVPAATLVWPIVALRFRRRGVTFGRYLGWVDLNLIACLQRTMLRPLVRAPSDWVPAGQMPQVTHRLGATDPM